MKRIILGAMAAAVVLITPALACETITSTKVKVSACIDTTGWATQALLLTAASAD